MYPIPHTKGLFSLSHPVSRQDPKRRQNMKKSKVLRNLAANVVPMHASQQADYLLLAFYMLV
ncbi:hypothetical protein CCM_08950 [Cordyceps militaris CM01]|uniref:Uncharacterized protein n=1 Tax=Cordyceps militaris (strain CM01) TaxID=983644 RepID=G3JSQ7_CORMM|nr:uncharacterized protein CCM_08950 [Cordyceps militaris CM01]EGX88903.1 hypothetical protein CCM_08950 [Cordyceps militaris CM01]